MTDLLFYPGTHQVGDAKHFDRVCISRNRLVGRKKPVECDDVLLDCAGFTTIEKHGGYPHPPEEWAREVHRLNSNGILKITVVVAQDYMCEPWMLAKTGLTIEDHQRLTIGRFDAVIAELHRLYDGPPPFEVMPVLQGFAISDYLRHIEMYGDRLTPGMWVGVGSVCKRQGDPAIIEDLLLAIAGVRPDLRLHGFRCEADGTPQSHRSPAALQRGQHGLVLCSSEAGPRRQRLARSQGVRGARSRPQSRARATAIVLGMISTNKQVAPQSGGEGR